MTQPSDPIPDTTSTTPESTKIGCCGWLRGELSCKTPLFGLTDPNGKTIDLKQSFGILNNNGRGQLPLPVLTATKFGFLVWCIVTLVNQWVITTYPYWFIAYLTQWTLLMTCIYMTCSLYLSTVTIPPTNSPTTNIADNIHSDNHHLHYQGLTKYQWQLVKITWTLFSIVSSVGGSVVLMYWLAIYDYTTGTLPSYYTVMSHGVSFVLVLIDGFILNKIPLRLKHYIFSLLFGLLFVTWSIIAAVTHIDNPDTTSEDNTEALYNILDWNNSPISATITSAGVNLIVLPIFTIIYWIISISCCRKYIDEENEPTSGEVGGRGGATRTTTITGDKMAVEDNGSDTHVGEHEDEDIEEGGIEAKPY